MAINICRRIMGTNSFVIEKNMKVIKEFSERTRLHFCSYMSTNSSTFDTKAEKAEFLKALPLVIDDLAKHPKFQEIPGATNWMKEVLHGNITGGKNGRGLTTVLTYKTIENPENITEDNLQLARTLGWCTEILQAYCCVLDDIADESVTRRGMPCWYRREDVGIANAVNDATLLHYCILRILRTNFENSPFYKDMVHNFNETLFYTCLGQHLDIMAGLNKKDFKLFTIDHYNAIVEHKSAYYTYRLPISLGFMLANKFNEETQKNVNDISLQLGRLFQMQDDYIDCYGDVNLTGKLGSDIQERKCSWLAVNALQRCNSNQRAVFTVCYGSKEPAHVERIKTLYDQLKIPQHYKDTENQLYNNIVQRIQTISAASERDAFLKILGLIYGRKH